MLCSRPLEYIAGGDAIRLKKDKVLIILMKRSLKGEWRMENGEWRMQKYKENEFKKKPVPTQRQAG